MECVYWDHSKNGWSSEGCHLVKSESNRDVTVCECDHLTNFAALLDITEKNDTFKSIMTNICCGVSAIFLVFTILLICLEKERKNLSFNSGLIDRKKVITFNLCICLMFSYLLIVFGMDRIDFPPKVLTFEVN